MLNFRDAAASVTIVIDKLTFPVRCVAFDQKVIRELKKSGVDDLGNNTVHLFFDIVTGGLPALIRSYKDDPDARDFLAIRKSAKYSFKPTPAG